MAVRAEVLPEVLIDLASLEDSWQVFIGDDDAGIGFAVLEQDVVSGRPLLDEVVLEQKRVLFRLDYYVLDIPYLSNENGGLSVVVFFREIGIDASAEVLCLAYIYNGTRLVEILIASRALGQVADDAHQIGSDAVFFAFLHRFSNVLLVNRLRRCLKVLASGGPTKRV